MRSLKRFLPELAVAAVFVAFVCAVVPFWSFFELDVDEGINLAKSTLVSQGHALYSDIWSDQPPLFTWILGAVFRVFGFSVTLARGVILVFSTLLVTSFFSLTRARFGTLPAALATGILVASNFFARLSASVMIGMVCLSFFVMSIRALYFANEASSARKPQPWFFLSGVLAGCALCTKLFVLPWLCLLAIQAVWKNRGAFAWLLGLAVVFVPVVFLCGRPALSQLTAPHLAAFASGDSIGGGVMLLNQLLSDWYAVILAAAGTFVVFRSRSRGEILPVLWFFSALVILSRHRPLFYHHYVLIAIPAAWLSAVCLAKLFESRSRWAHAGVLAAVYFIFLNLTYVIDRGRRTAAYEDVQAPQRSALIQELSGRIGKARWIFTDRPMYALRAGLAVPPEIAVLTHKRVLLMDKKEIGAPFVEKIVDKYGIDQVLLARYSRYSGEVSALLNNRFERRSGDFPPGVEYFSRGPARLTATDHTTR